ncbi:MBL fold metallo-hydrolase [Saccharopolyspora sp. NPDC047091]|uniref:MBL fold metallo-hydrolase n=1 Tax=Saccharopolyspora sp. NPDC047091 TaxID=3155924 RepID=UPI0033CEE9EC
MSTTVTLTGTGVPFPSADRAGAGTLIRHEDIAIQVDAGRGTTLRLAGLGVLPHDLSALLLTHLHSDHVVDVADLVHTRWVQDHLVGSGPLPVVACDGHARRFLDRVLDAYEYDVAVRREHVQENPPSLVPTLFPLPEAPTEVWADPTGRVRVEAVRVRHEPVEQAVAYRITTPDAVVVVSGDTRVCDEVQDLARGADVLVHEACRASSLQPFVAGSAFETIFSYHADTVALGELAAKAGVGKLVLTHLIPAPESDEDRAAYEREVRDGGWTGPLVVGSDLDSVVVG